VGVEWRLGVVRLLVFERSFERPPGVLDHRALVTRARETKSKLLELRIIGRAGVLDHRALVTSASNEC
jgi:hypothetical protein